MVAGAEQARLTGTLGGGGNGAEMAKLKAFTAPATPAVPMEKLSTDMTAALKLLPTLKPKLPAANILALGKVASICDQVQGLASVQAAASTRVAGLPVPT